MRRNCLTLATSTLQVYAKLLWPLRFLYVKPAVEQTSAFLHLPIDIICMICDQLPLSAKILLSQTCKAMWYMLPSQCSVRSKALVPEDRFNTLAELGNFLPDNYHCITCKRLHPVRPDDIPDLTNWYRRRHVCFTRNLESDHLRPQKSYAVFFHHVQLALKYSRMKEKHQDCRKNILQKFEMRPVGSPILKTFSAKPRVVNARFILLMTYVLYAGPLRDAATTDYKKYLQFCPHHLFGLGTGRGFPFAALLQKAAINAATMQDRHTELFSCDE